MWHMIHQKNQARRESIREGTAQSRLYDIDSTVIKMTCIEKFKEHQLRRESCNHKHNAFIHSKPVVNR